MEFVEEGIHICEKNDIHNLSFSIFVDFFQSFFHQKCKLF